MNKLIFSLVCLGMLVAMSCRDSDVLIIDNSTVQKGTIAMNFDGIPNDVKAIVARLTRSGFSEKTITLTVSDTTLAASGTFEDVQSGTWHLTVDAYDSSLSVIQYSGEADVEVLQGQTVVVELELEATTGDVQINIVWGKACQPAVSGLVSWWSGDGTMNDLRGWNVGMHVFPSSYIQGPSFVPGHVGKAFYFDGNGYDRVVIPDADNLKLTGSMTIESWIYPLSSPAQNRGSTIFFRGDDIPGGYDPYSLGIVYTDSIQFHIESKTASTDIRARIRLDRWTHVAGTLDSTTGDMKVYVNGQLAASKMTTVRPYRDLDPAYSPGVAIGNVQGTRYNYSFHGMIDEVSVYNRNLSEEEIAAIFNAGRSGKCKN